MSVVSSYPKYINDISDLEEKVKWKKRYESEYQQKYEAHNNNWYGLKALVSTTTMIAAVVFASIMIGVSGGAAALVVGGIIALDLTGASLALALACFFGSKADCECTYRGTMPNTFPLSFELMFDEDRLRQQQLKLLQASAGMNPPAYAPLTANV